LSKDSHVVLALFRLLFDEFTQQRVPSQISGRVHVEHKQLYVEWLVFDASMQRSQRNGRISRRTYQRKDHYKYQV